MCHVWSLTDVIESLYVLKDSLKMSIIEVEWPPSLCFLSKGSIHAGLFREYQRTFDGNTSERVCFLSSLIWDDLSLEPLGTTE